VLLENNIGNWVDGRKLLKTGETQLLGTQFLDIRVLLFAYIQGFQPQKLEIFSRKRPSGSGNPNWQCEVTRMAPLCLLQLNPDHRRMIMDLVYGVFILS
jgi:hypothetical protein